MNATYYLQLLFIRVGIRALHVAGLVDVINSLTHDRDIISAVIFPFPCFLSGCRSETTAVLRGKLGGLVRRKETRRWVIERTRYVAVNEALVWAI